MRFNNNQKRTIYIWLLLVAAAFFLWIGFGGEVFTKTQILVEKQDELLGTTYKEWKDQFVLGLDYTLAFSGIITLVALVMMWRFKTKRS
jgi:hypothetical protein